MNDVSGRRGQREPAWPLAHAEVDGMRLAYVDRGPEQADPVVLLHGYLGSHRTWRHQIEPLAAAHRVVAPDWFGWGAEAGHFVTEERPVEVLRAIEDLLART